jgi:hypothetical protein
MSIKITDENYSTYKSVFEVFWTHFSKLLPLDMHEGPSPIKVLNQFEAKGKSYGKRSLQSGIGDLITMTQDFPNTTIEAIDKDLKAKKLPSYSSLKATILDTERKVLKRGKIRNLDEYYIIQELLSDVSRNFTEEEFQKLSSYCSEFEEKSTHGG